MNSEGKETLWRRLVWRGGWRNLSIILIAAILLELVSALQYYYAHDLLEEEMEDHVLTVLNYKAYSLRQALNSSEQTLREHLWDVRRNLNHPDSLYGVLARAVQANDKVVGGFLCFMPDYFPEKGRLFEPYVYEVDSEIRMEQIGGKEATTIRYTPPSSGCWRATRPSGATPMNTKAPTACSSR